MVAKIEPEWVEPLAGHLVKRTYSEPHWEKKRGSAVAYEQVTLYGVPIVASRKVPYGRIDPQTSRELFLRHALVEGDWVDPPRVLRRQPGSCSRRRETWKPAPAVATSSSTTRRSTPSTTPASPPTSSPAATSTAGGRRPGARARTC